jgi:hypothetical protein
MLKSKIVNNYLNELYKIHYDFSFKNIEKNINNETHFVNIEFIPEDVDRVSVTVHYMDKKFNQVLPSISCGYLNKKLASKITHLNSGQESKLKNELSKLIKSKLKKENIKINKKIVFNIHDREIFSL